MDVRHKDRQQHFTVSLEAMVGDIPACSAICGHTGHTAYYGCRICEAKAVAVPTSRYFPQTIGTPLPPYRTIEDFILQSRLVKLYHVYMAKLLISYYYVCRLPV